MFLDIMERGVTTMENRKEGHTSMDPVGHQAQYWAGQLRLLSIPKRIQAYQATNHIRKRSFKLV